jgi:hypothetical protein
MTGLAHQEAMNNLVQNRIRQQTPPFPRRQTPTHFIPPNTTISPVISDLPASSSELHKVLTNNVLESVISSVQENTNTNIESVSNPPLVFNEIGDFVRWYIPLRDKFEQNAKEALNTLVAAQEAVGNGCACMRNRRWKTAMNYYRTFWHHNKTSPKEGIPSLVEVVKKISGASKITFTYNGEVIAEI